ncbi:MAG TPA: dihydropteroate synthase, partial [Porphyromonadaceae bacterium]|nr:dihydropteroate synthase [Porphyromonadaceae bacterium]
MDLKIDSKFPLIMGILNCTPDSFYSKSCLHGANDIIQQASKMLSDGATIFDIGGCSTRPNATFPTNEEEWKRLRPSLEILRNTFPNIPISVDTFRTEIAKRSIEEFEVEIINDISGGEEEGMFPL